MENIKDRTDILDFDKKYGFTQIPNVLIMNLRKLRISGNEFTLLTIIRRFAYQKDNSFPAIRTINKISGMSTSTIERLLSGLEKKRYLIIVRKSNLRNLYSFKPLNQLLEKLMFMEHSKDEDLNCDVSKIDTCVSKIDTCVSKIDTEEEIYKNNNTNTPLPPNENKKCEGELISNQNLKTLSKKYSEKEVDIAYQFLKHLIKQGKQIKDPLAFLFTLLKNKTYEDITEIETQRQQKEMEERKNKSQQYKQQELDDYLDIKADEIFETINPEEKSEKINEIKKTLQCNDQLKDGFAILQLKALIRKDLESHLINSS
ncbi:MAG: helix-turn-helix domain-containing protein [bacterium]